MARIVFAREHPTIIRIYGGLDDFFLKNVSEKIQLEYDLIYVKKTISSR